MWLRFGGRGWCLHRRCPARPDSTRSNGVMTPVISNTEILISVIFMMVPGGVAGGVACRTAIVCGVQSRDGSSPAVPLTYWRKPSPKTRQLGNKRHVVR